MIETCGKQHADLSDKQSSKYAGVSIALMNDLIDNYKVSLCFLLENHANVQKAKSIIKRMKFNAHHVIASNGQSRRLWYMWNSDVWQIKILEENAQFMYLEVKKDQQARALVFYNNLR